MAYEKTYRTIIPVEHDADLDQLRWLARESFERKAASEGLNIVDYAEREVDVDEIPPKTMELLGRPLTEFQWFEFTGLARLNQVLMEWCTAECVWRSEQLGKWLAAETVWKVGQVRDWLNAERVWLTSA